jgi:hypothetical protein
VFEYATEMRDSYFMISPSGNVIINNKDPGKEVPLSEVTIASLSEILNVNSYITRGAIYDWK